MAKKARPPSLFALLIGIDHYFEYPLPNGLYYPRLGGCVRDITKVRNFLTTRLDLKPSSIIELTSSLGKDGPPESPDQLPTYMNMVKAIKQLTRRVHAGDQVYIHYAGHGGRTTTMFPDIKGKGAFDEGLVPPDIGAPDDPNARYLRDVEIHYLLQKLVDKKVRLTVVFDCCHSGGATRDIGGARKRGISRPDETPPPTQSAVVGKGTLSSRWKKGGAARTRGMDSEGSWLFEPSGYTLLAACRASESSFEYPFDGKESNGALTYWLLDTLAQAGPHSTWRAVADRVSAKVRSQFVDQTPMLQGEGAYQVFGAEKLDVQFGVSVLEVDKPKRRIRIAAGEAHGLAVGTRFQIVADVAKAGYLDKATATIEITDVDVTTSWAKVDDPKGKFTVEVGDQASMLSSSAVQLQHFVRVSIVDAPLRRKIETAIKANGQGFVVLAKKMGSADFLVDMHDKRPEEYVIQDASGCELPNLRPALNKNDPAVIDKLVNRLVHLAKFRNVQSLEMPDAAVAANLDVKVNAKAVNRPGDTVEITVANTQKPNPDDDNDPEHILNITMLALSSDWSITQIYPSGASEFEPVDPEQSIPLQFDVSLPEGLKESQETIKIFATRSPTNFRWLELPALDQPHERSMKRDLVRDPLEQILSMVTGDKVGERSIRLSASPEPDRGWTVAQVDIRVKGNS